MSATQVTSTSTTQTLASGTQQGPSQTSSTSGQRLGPPIGKSSDTGKGKQPAGDDDDLPPPEFFKNVSVTFDTANAYELKEGDEAIMVPPDPFTFYTLKNNRPTPQESVAQDERLGQIYTLERVMDRIGLNSTALSVLDRQIIVAIWQKSQLCREDPEVLAQAMRVWNAHEWSTTFSDYSEWVITSKGILECVIAEHADIPFFLINSAYANLFKQYWRFVFHPDYPGALSQAARYHDLFAENTTQRYFAYRLTLAELNVYLQLLRECACPTAQIEDVIAKHPGYERGYDTSGRSYAIHTTTLYASSYQLIVRGDKKVKLDKRVFIHETPDSVIGREYIPPPVSFPLLARNRRSSARLLPKGSPAPWESVAQSYSTSRFASTPGLVAPLIDFKSRAIRAPRPSDAYLLPERLIPEDPLVSAAAVPDTSGPTSFRFPKDAAPAARRESRGIHLAMEEVLLLDEDRAGVYQAAVYAPQPPPQPRHPLPAVPETPTPAAGSTRALKFVIPGPPNPGGGGYDSNGDNGGSGGPPGGGPPAGGPPGGNPPGGPPGPPDDDPYGNPYRVGDSLPCSNSSAPAKSTWDPFRAKAPTFSGDITKSFEFLTRCKTLFAGDDRYQGDSVEAQRRKIMVIVNQLEGNAFQWYAQSARTTGHWGLSWKAFQDAFLLRYGDPARHYNAIQRIHNCQTQMCMKSTDTIQDHIGFFEDMLVLANYKMRQTDRISLLHSTLTPVLRSLVRTANFQEYDLFVNHVILTAQEEQMNPSQPAFTAAGTGDNGQRRFVPFCPRLQQPATTTQQAPARPSNQAQGTNPRPQGPNVCAVNVNDPRQRVLSSAPPGLGRRGSLSHKKPNFSTVPPQLQGDLAQVADRLAVDSRCYTCRQKGHMRYQCPYEPIPQKNTVNVRSALMYYNQDEPPQDEEVYEEEAYFQEEVGELDAFEANGFEMGDFEEPPADSHF
ncbi:hypothetical protein CcaverHIS631_0301550 [Cutaneotrichosporon cavernicola]|nr:hypothetical protein CcaverHIS631_0301550 [Cutaneotrichosporon cavernicola]BEJ05634.1 hypothetical protein CcaverHIS641_0301560 [Cutaneotrichosporon cavernicola]